MTDSNKLKSYYFTAVISLLFAVIGFTYNAWRMEVSESNNNVRTASFEVLKELADFERVIFAAHYDQDSVKGNPREGWVKVGLISDLSVLIGKDVEQQAATLQEYWSDNWQALPRDARIAEGLVERIDMVRTEIKQELSNLQ